MKNKYFYFSLSLSIAILFLMILSIFVKDSIFEEIAQAITIPFLSFTLVCFAVSVSEEIINSCNSNVQLEVERHKLWEYYKEVLLRDLCLVSRYETPRTDHEREMNELITERENRYLQANDDALKCIKKIDIYSQIIKKCEQNHILQVLYVMTLSLLIVSMMITPILSVWCQFIPTTTITLLSLFVAIMEILLKDAIAQKILRKMYKTIAKKIEEETDNGQTQNAQPE